MERHNALAHTIMSENLSEHRANLAYFNSDTMDTTVVADMYIAEVTIAEDAIASPSLGRMGAALNIAIKQRHATELMEN